MYPETPLDEDGLARFIDCITSGNERWMSEYIGKPPFNGSARTAVLTCMDSRIPPLEMLGLVPGEVFILRNAGNTITPDSLRSLLVCLTTMCCRNVLIVGHSNCGMRAPLGPGADVKEMIDLEAFRTYMGMEKAELSQLLGFHHHLETDWVRQQVDDLRKVLKSVMPSTSISVVGAVYHLEDGRLELIPP